MASKVNQEEEKILFPDQRPSFCQVVWSSSSPKHLLIPDDFTKNVPVNCAESAVLSIPPSDLPYEITLEKNKKGMYLEHGWGKFCLENSLGHNELLVFTYNDKIVDKKVYFDVSIFNQDCVRDTSTSTSTSSGNRKPDMGVETEEENVSKFPETEEENVSKFPGNPRTAAKDRLSERN